MDDRKIFRFKFSNSFSQKLEQFTRIHKFDKSKDFKEAWNEWKDDNNKKQAIYLTLMNPINGILRL